mgnify:CR=1 FL=1
MNEASVGLGDIHFFPRNHAAVIPYFAAVLEGDDAFLIGKKSMVVPYGYVFTREKLCAALADNHIARARRFSRVELNPQIMRV